MQFVDIMDCLGEFGNDDVFEIRVHVSVILRLIFYLIDKDMVIGYSFSHFLVGLPYLFFGITCVVFKHCTFIQIDNQILTNAISNA